MKLTNIVIIPVISLFMVACGGESTSTALGSDESPDTTTIVEPIIKEEIVFITEDEVVTEKPGIIIESKPDPDAIYETTSELIAAKSFLLDQEYSVSVSYQNDDNRNVYLSICTDFSEDEVGINVNYNSCLLRTSIEGHYSSKITIGNDKNRLVMALWYLDDLNNPRYEIWENDINTAGLKEFEVN